MPPSTKLLNQPSRYHRNPPATKTVLTAAGLGLGAAAAALPFPWNLVLMAIGGILGGAAHVPQPGAQ